MTWKFVPLLIQFINIFVDKIKISNFYRQLTFHDQFKLLLCYWSTSAFILIPRSSSHPTSHSLYMTTTRLNRVILHAASVSFTGMKFFFLLLSRSIHKLTSNKAHLKRSKTNQQWIKVGRLEGKTVAYM